MKVRWRDRFVYLVARAAIGTAAVVPQWFGYGLAGLLGRCWFVVDRRRRGYALRFLRQAFPGRPDRELLRIGSRATANLFQVPLDMARLTRLIERGGRIEQVLDARTVGPVLDALPRPFLGLTAHLGNWEVAAIAVAQRVGGADGVARITKNPLLNRWVLHNRARGGLVIHSRRGGIRGLAKALEHGRVGLQVVDQNQRLRGVFAPFFGKLASCERAAVSLALRCGHPIIVGGAVRRGCGFRFELIASEPFTLTPTGDKTKDLLAGVERVNRAIEELVRRAPEQYLWIHDRYRTQPKPGQSLADSDEDVVDAES